MIKSPKLKYNGTGYFNSKSWNICIDSVRKYFNVPRNVQHIQFYAYKKAAPERVPVTLMHRYPDDILLKVEGSREIVFTHTIRAIKRLTGAWKEWHVILYYWK